jgi:hypothetical protein
MQLLRRLVAKFDEHVTGDSDDRVDDRGVAVPGDALTDADRHELDAERGSGTQHLADGSARSSG